MSIQELGSIGELIGAVAVLFTLVYLAVQTRQTRIAAELSAYFTQLRATNDTIELYARWRQYLQNQELTAIIAKANLQEELSAAEATQLGSAFDELFTAAAASHANSLQGKALYDASADILYLQSVFDANPCASAEWKRFRPISDTISSELVTTIDNYLEQTRDA